MAEKTRLDLRLIAEGYAASREKAKVLVGSGAVSVNGRPAKKAGEEVSPEDVITVSADAFAEDKYVSRGGYKLEGALDAFGFDPSGLTCLDAGCSTGGFTDCLLQRGAAHVYAVDVGHGQFSPKLKKDPRVTEKEGVNVRYLNQETVPCLCDLTVADLSYISLTKVLGALAGRTKAGGSLICLVKPQFEAGPGAVDKHGVIKDAETRCRVLEQVLAYARAIGLTPVGLTHSPILGPEGNIEFLLYLKNGPLSEEQAASFPKLPSPEQVVKNAQLALGKAKD